MAQFRNNPIPDTLESVPGFPTTLQIYRMPASRYWYARASFNGKRIVRSLKTERHANAITAAKDFYNGLLLKRSQGQPLTEGSQFKTVAEALLNEDRARVERGERKPSIVTDCEYILEKDLLPFFRTTKIKDINYKKILEYTEHLRKRNVSSQTIKNHYIHLRKILKHAHKMEMLDKLPIFPTISTQDNPREWLNDDQFAKLLETTNKAIKDKAKPYRIVITEHLRDLTNFMVNTFLRPQDIKLLQHKHISVIKDPRRGTYLRMMARGKTAPAQVVSTQAAVGIYGRLKGDPEAFVFFPELLNRAYAMSIMSKQFKYVLEQADLYKTESGERTLYSLRHTCIMNQLLHGKWSLFTLAKNCRTSPEMIQRFYGSHLEAEMNVQHLYQQAEAGDNLDDFFEDEA
jgi:Phage integrase SAM-like domain